MAWSFIGEMVGNLFRKRGLTTDESVGMPAVKRVCLEKNVEVNLHDITSHASDEGSDGSSNGTIEQNETNIVPVPGNYVITPMFLSSTASCFQSPVRLLTFSDIVIFEFHVNARDIVERIRKPIPKNYGNCHGKVERFVNFDTMMYDKSDFSVKSLICPAVSSLRRDHLMRFPQIRIVFDTNVTMDQAIHALESILSIELTTDWLLLLGEINWESYSCGKEFKEEFCQNRSRGNLLEFEISTTHLINTGEKGKGLDDALNSSTQSDHSNPLVMFKEDAEIFPSFFDTLVTTP